MTKTANVVKLAIYRMTAQMGGARGEAVRLWNSVVKLHKTGCGFGLTTIRACKRQKGFSKFAWSASKSRAVDFSCAARV